jgi:hypothetical protein
MKGYQLSLTAQLISKMAVSNQSHWIEYKKERQSTSEETNNHYTDI